MPPINGNKILQEIVDKRNSIPDNSGFVRNNMTGESYFIKGSDENGTQQSAFAPQTPIAVKALHNIPPNQENYMGESKDIYTGEDNNGGVGYGKITNMGGGTEHYEDSMEDKHEEIAGAMNDAKIINDYFKSTGTSMDDYYNDIDPKIKDEWIKLAMNPDTIKNREGFENASVAIEGLLDALGVDHEKFYNDGVLEECGSECQERRQLQKMQGQKMSENDNSVLRMNDDDFNQKYDGVTL